MPYMMSLSRKDFIQETEVILKTSRKASFITIIQSFLDVREAIAHQNPPNLTYKGVINHIKNMLIITDLGEPCEHARKLELKLKLGLGLGPESRREHSSETASEFKFKNPRPLPPYLRVVV